MARATSKLQVTIPKAIAARYGIKPGDELDWIEEGESIRVANVSGVPRDQATEIGKRLRQFDEATLRQQAREKSKPLPKGPSGGRGWTREELYRRGRSR